MSCAAHSSRNFSTAEPLICIIPRVNEVIPVEGTTGLDHLTGSDIKSKVCYLEINDAIYLRSNEPQQTSLKFDKGFQLQELLQGCRLRINSFDVENASTPDWSACLCHCPNLHLLVMVRRLIRSDAWTSPWGVIGR